MRGLLSAKVTLIMVTLIATFTAGVGGTVLMDELSVEFEGTTEVADVEAIVAQLVEDIQVLTLEIDTLNSDNDDLEAASLVLQAQIDALVIERDELIAELDAANASMVQFKIDICTVIDTLPPQQRDNYDLWCGVYGEGIPVEPGDYLEGTYTATVYATEYTSYSDEDFTTITVIVDEDGWITSVVFLVHTTGGVDKYDISYASWLNWDDQADAVIATIIDDQDALLIDSIAGVSISISGFELAFDTAMAGALAP